MAKTSHDVIRINVGNRYFLTYRWILLKTPTGSELYKLSQSERSKTKLDARVINRDGKHFGAILGYIRDKYLELSDYTMDDLKCLQEEAEFYKLKGLRSICLAEQELRENRDKGNLEALEKEPSKALFFTETDAIKYLRKTKDMAIVASTGILSKIERSEMYRVYYPYSVYFYADDFRSHISLYEEDGRLLDVVSCGEADEIQKFADKIKSEHLESSDDESLSE